MSISANHYSDHEKAEPVYRHLEQMFVGLQSWLETDPSPRERAQMHRSCQNGWRPGASRDGTPTRNSAEPSAAMR